MQKTLSCVALLVALIALALSLTITANSWHLPGDQTRKNLRSVHLSQSRSAAIIRVEFAASVLLRHHDPCTQESRFAMTDIWISDNVAPQQSLLSRHVLNSFGSFL